MPAAAAALSPPVAVRVGGFAGGGGRTHSARIRSEAFSAIMIVAALVLPEMTAGITEASMTRNPSMPWTRSSVSTTALSCEPIMQVLVWWKVVLPVFLACSRRPASLSIWAPGQNSSTT
jgi:hypothetical protein